MRAVGGERIEGQAEPVLGADRGPECPRRLIGFEDKQMTLGDAGRAKALQGLADQATSQSAPARAIVDGKVMDQAPTPIVADEDGGDQHPLTQGHQAQTRIARKETLDLGPVIRAAQADPRRPQPQRAGGIVVTRVESLYVAHPGRLTGPWRFRTSVFLRRWPS